jgi:hypothetical protein
MATRPGYVWSGTEWVSIGQEAVLSPFYYQATAPSSPATGDIWVESDVDVPVETYATLTSSQTLTNKTLTSPIITGGILNGGGTLTVDSTELNKLDGVTTTTAQLNYLNTSSSDIQTQLNTKAPSASPTFSGNVDISLVSNSGLVTIETPDGNGFDFAVTDTATNVCLITPIVDGVRQGSNQFYYNSSTSQWIFEGDMRATGRITADNATFVRGGTAQITPVANAATSGNISWGATMPANPYVAASANSSTSVVKNVQFSSANTTGCTVWIVRENTTSTAVNAVAVSI